MFRGALFRPVLLLTISVDTADVNLFTLAGSPAAATTVICTINPGVTVFRTAGAASFRTGVFPAGSSLKLINLGKVMGSGGQGGSGSSTGLTAGNNGLAGGDAILLDFDMTIDNSAGYIQGGGGGGGGGQGDRFNSNNIGGGGGGGGIGNFSAPGGAAGAGTPPGNAGGSGSATNPGGGGLNGGGAYKAGNGANFGATGATASASFGITPATGGAGGYAVRLSGHAVTWVSGSGNTAGLIA